MKKKKLMKKQSCFVVLLMMLLLFPSGAFAQQQMIKGQVVDDKGETIIGATVMVKGAKEGTLTDIDGNFSVKGKVGNTLSIDVFDTDKRCVSRCRTLCFSVCNRSLVLKGKR